jgi:predicted DNA-binding WGR domain protein
MSLSLDTGGQTQTIKFKRQAGAIRATAKISGTQKQRKLYESSSY